MKAMILAAGFGKRLMPLTAEKPKPLLNVGGKPLIQWRIEALVDAGITEIIINHAYLGQQIVDFCGAGEKFGAQITYSPEPEPLETAMGINNVLDFFENQPFLIVNADIFTDFPLQKLTSIDLNEDLAHLVMVDNPKHNPKGDFSVTATNQLALPQNDTLTYSGMALLTPAFFDAFYAGEKPLKPLFLKAIEAGKISASKMTGFWEDVGTPERYEMLNQQLRA
ncbi:MAG: nucleotidyltransferase family protein [Cellvibrionales bacterium]|nr:nucleotidyltransferase family protein [Cellvibrionales bacterium]